MRKIDPVIIEETVRDLAVKASIDLAPDVEFALREALELERHKLARYALGQIVENIQVARERKVPICQDTGYFSVFIRFGPDVQLPSNIQRLVDSGIARATREAYLRASVVKDPLFHRVNTGDNTPVQLHLEQDAGEGELSITVFPKGGGSENATQLEMLLPTAGVREIEERVVRMVEKKAPSACPPVVVGIGLGGSADTALLAGKKALLRPLGTKHELEEYSALENQLLQAINRLGIGAAGLGGSNTAIAVHIEAQATHIANLALAVVISCHALRRSTGKI